jgi:hypothetical protein
VHLANLEECVATLKKTGKAGFREIKAYLHFLSRLAGSRMINASKLVKFKRKE